MATDPEETAELDRMCLAICTCGAVAAGGGGCLPTCGMFASVAPSRRQMLRARLGNVAMDYIEQVAANEGLSEEEFCAALEQMLDNMQIERRARLRLRAVECGLLEDTVDAMAQWTAKQLNAGLRNDTELNNALELNIELVERQAYKV